MDEPDVLVIEAWESAGLELGADFDVVGVNVTRTSRKQARLLRLFPGEQIIIKRGRVRYRILYFGLGTYVQIQLRRWPLSFFLSGTSETICNAVPQDS